MNVMLTVNKLTKAFPMPFEWPKKADKPQKKIAVNDVSFSVKKGEAFGIVGPTGAGKSTLLHLIATVAKPDSGAITLDGADVVKHPKKACHKIGYMTTHFPLDETCTPNYLFDYYSKLYGIESKLAGGRKSRLLEDFGICDLANKPINELSLAVKQKLSIALALIHDPDVLILDEPTNGMDILFATELAQRLKASGKTVILASNDPYLIKHTCNRVGILADGKITSIVDTVSTLDDTLFEAYEEMKGSNEHV